MAEEEHQEVELEQQEKLAQTAIPIPINAPLPKVQRLDKVGSLYSSIYTRVCVCLGMQ